MLDTDQRQQILDAMCALLPRVLPHEAGAPTGQSRMNEDLGMTSATTLELLLELEESLEIQIDVEDIAMTDVATLDTLADYIVAHLTPAS